MKSNSPYELRAKIESGFLKITNNLFVRMKIVISIIIIHSITAAVKKDITEDSKCPLGDGSIGNCRVVELGMSKFTLNEAALAFNELDYDNSIRRVRMKLSEISEEYGKEMDSFLQPRPWWVLLNEPYTWKTNDEKVVELVQFNAPWNIYLQKKSKIQYPAKCDAQLIIQYTNGFSEWGNQIFNYANNAAINKWAIFTPYMYGKQVAFLDDGYCSNHNKFTCGFLPMTNCSLPDVLTTTSESKSNYYSSCNKDGVALKDPWDRATKDKELYDSQNFDTPSVSYTIYKPAADPGGVPIVQSGGLNIGQEALLNFGLIFRLNYDFRSRVAHLIHDVKKNYTKPFPTNGDCVAIHIRRHDRAVKGVNMHDWCTKHARQKNNTCLDHLTGAWSENVCNRWYDMGCHSKTPFGTLHLKDYLAAAKIVRNTSSNVFIMTDDSKWLAAEMEAFKGEWNIFTMPIARLHRKASIENGVTFLSSLALVRECSGLVGHSVSAIYNLLVRQMCARHAGKFGVCPPTFDFA